MVNLEKFYYYPEEDVYAIRVFKLRDANIPSKIKDGEEAMPIPLDPDEYIGEDLNFLYDRKNSICMLQQNRMSMGVSRLVEWINQVCPIENGRVVFIPLADRFTSERLGKKMVRSIEFSFANLEPDDKCGSLGQIISSFNKYGGATGRIMISVGKAKDAQLNKGNTVDLIDDLQRNSGMINSAKVKLKEENISDDDKAHVEIVDIFENSIHDYLQFDIEVKKPLDFMQAHVKMLSKYMERRKGIEELCQW